MTVGDEASEYYYASSLCSALWLDEVLVNLHRIYWKRTFLVDSLVRLSGNFIVLNKKEKDNKKIEKGSN